MQLLTLAPKPVPASSPIATLPLPSTFKRSASSPIAVLLEPDVLFSNARSPNALFSLPVFITSALRPCALLKVTVDVTKERICAEGVVVGAAVVMDKRISSNGGVHFASGVEKQCSTANCGVIIRAG